MPVVVLWAGSGVVNYCATRRQVPCCMCVATRLHVSSSSGVVIH